MQHLTCCSMKGSRCSISNPASGSASAATPAFGVARGFAGFCLANLTTEAPPSGACSAAGCLPQRLGLGAAAAVNTGAGACSAAGCLPRRFGLGTGEAGAREAPLTPVVRGCCAWPAVNNCSFGASGSSWAASSVACWRTSLESHCIFSKLPSSTSGLISAAS